MAAHIGKPRARPRLRLAPELSQEARARHAYAYFEHNTPAPLPQSPAARTVREIERIAGWYRWEGEVQRALDSAGVQVIADMGEDALQALLERMRKLENCIQTGCDAPDAAPAR